MIVYTTTNCPKCTALKNYLKTHNIVYEEKNLEDTEIMAELILKNIHIQAAPAIQIGNQIYTLFGEL